MNVFQNNKFFATLFETHDIVFHEKNEFPRRLKDLLYENIADQLNLSHAMFYDNFDSGYYLIGHINDEDATIDVYAINYNLTDENCEEMKNKFHKLPVSFGYTMSAIITADNKVYKNLFNLTRQDI